MSGTLPSWIEHWLGLSGGPGMGVAWRLDYHWPWPAWASLLGVALLVAAIVGIYLRESRQASRCYRLALAAMRLLVLGLALLMIAQVELFLQRTGLPFVVVIIDDTQSMNTVDSYDEGARKLLRDRVARALTTSHAPELSRWNVARMLFAENGGQLLTALSDSHKLRFYYLSEMKESRRTDVPGIVEELKAAEANGESTRLGAAVRGALDELRGTTPAAIVLATDGINTEGPGLLDAAAYARRKGVPLLLIGVGSDRPARDLTLSDLEVEDVVFVNDLVPFRFKLAGAGFAGKTVAIVLRREKQSGVGTADKGKTVGRIEVTVVADGRPQEVVIPHRPEQTGQFRYTIDVEPPAGDPPTLHPPLARTIQVREDKIRVLLVDGSPRFEYRFLRNMLGRDKTIELHVLLQGADIDTSDQGSNVRDPTRNVADTERVITEKVFPVSSKDLSAYDVVIFGDVNPSLLSPSARAEPGRFRRSSGQGRRLGARGRPELHAAGLPRHAAGEIDAVRSGQGAEFGTGQAADRRFRCPADRDGAGQPLDATGRHAAAVAGRLAEAAAIVLDDRSLRPEAFGTGLGRAPDPLWPGRQAAAADYHAVRRRRRQGALSRHG